MKMFKSINFFRYFPLFLGFLCPVAIPAGEVEIHPADSRVDLIWNPVDVSGGYNIYRSSGGSDVFIKLNSFPHPVPVYSDWIGKDANGKKFFYKIKAIQGRTGEVPLNSEPVAAVPYSMQDDELLTSIQHATFRYFWNYAHGISGLTRERYFRRNDICSSGASGFGALAVMIGVERGFVAREDGVERLLRMVRFLSQADRFHGAWPHWMNGETGKALPFSEYDDGGDIVETALLMQGLLAVRQYFNKESKAEAELCSVITKLWHEIEWDWYFNNQQGSMIWHWSPKFGWKMNHKVCGFNECMIVYLLGVASPSHPVPVESWKTGWASSKDYINGKTYYDIRQDVGPPMGGPLFLSHYSFVCFDPRNRHDEFTNYFENSRAITLIHQAYCVDNPGRFKGYSDQVWGLTACDGPDGYGAFAPGKQRDNGTVAPTAGVSSMPFTPEESMNSLKHFYYNMGGLIWGPFGFYDAFNLGRDWVSKTYIGIDQGPIICMIENARTGLCWNNFMKNPEIEPMLSKIGFVKE